MEHYEKGQVVEVDEPDGPFISFGVKFDDVLTMKVRNGSKIRNLLQFATKKMEDKETRKIIFTGMGPAVTKTVTCVEILKRHMKTLHQINKAYFRRTEEYWEPKLEGLDRLKVNRQVPALAVLLSKDPLDKNEPGYQAPGSFSASWREEAKRDKRRKNEKKQLAGGDGPSPKSRNRNHAGRQKEAEEGQGHMGGGRRTAKRRGNEQRERRSAGKERGEGNITQRTEGGGNGRTKDKRKSDEKTTMMETQEATDQPTSDVAHGTVAKHVSSDLGQSPCKMETNS